MVAGAWPIIGHLPLFSKSQATHHLLGTMADKYGPIFTIKLGTATTLVINNWKTAKECYTTNDIAVAYRPNLVAFEHMTYNYAMLGFAPYGPFWREMRKIVTLNFLSNHQINLLTHIRVSEIQTSIKELYNFWKNRKDENGYLLVEMKKWFNELAFNIVLRMVAGKRYFGESVMVKEEEANRCLNALRDYMRLIGVFPIADAVPFLRWFDFGGHEKNMKLNFKELDGVITEWLDEHKKKRSEGVDKSKEDQDFIDVMLSTIDGTNIHWFDSDTVIKATTMVCAYTITCVYYQARTLFGLNVSSFRTRHVSNTDTYNYTELYNIF
jgi:cytochrome P450